ncbi:MAG TPA: hypothetical protein VGG22_06760 [Candidatus Baltobacteraceae bacterium]
MLGAESLTQVVSANGTDVPLPACKGTSGAVSFPQSNMPGNVSVVLNATYCVPTPGVSTSGSSTTAPIAYWTVYFISSSQQPINGTLTMKGDLLLSYPNGSSSTSLQIYGGGETCVSFGDCSNATIQTGFVVTCPASVQNQSTVYRCPPFSMLLGETYSFAIQSSS